MPNHEGLPLKAQDNSREAYNSIHDESEYQKELQRKRINAIYSSVLTLISFQERRTPGAKEPLVTPYYEKALRNQKQTERIAKKEALESGEPVRKIERIMPILNVLIWQSNVVVINLKREFGKNPSKILLQLLKKRILIINLGSNLRRLLKIIVKDKTFHLSNIRSLR